MTVNVKKLVKMAEDITANMSYTDDREIVADKVANHLDRFWDPRMKQAISDYAAESNSALTASLRLAVSRLTHPITGSNKPSLDS